MSSRIVAALTVHGHHVVQTRSFRVRRVVDTVRACVDRLAMWDVDELLLLGIGEPLSPALIADCAMRCPTLLTVGGGLRTGDDVARVFEAGADRAVLTTGALVDPPCVGQAADRFGSHRIVVGVDASRRGDGSTQAMAHGGRTPSGAHPAVVARRLTGLGAGEVLLRSVDRDGSGIGFDIGLIQQVTRDLEHPVTVLGGAGAPGHLVEAVVTGGASHAAAGDLFVHTDTALIATRRAFTAAGIAHRPAREVADRQSSPVATRRRIGRNLQAAALPLPHARQRPASARWCRSCVVRLPEEPGDVLCDECASTGAVPAVEWTHRAEVLLRMLGAGSATGGHDCVVPVTGAAETSHVVERLVRDWGRSPLLVAYDGSVTGHGLGDLGRRLHRHHGVDLVVNAPSHDTVIRLARAGLFGFGDPGWHARVGVATTAMQVAVQRRIPTVVWGREVGLDLTADRTIGVPPEACRRHHSSQRERHVDPCAFEGVDGLTTTDLADHRYPSDHALERVGVRAFSLPGFVPWRPPSVGISEPTADAADAWMDIVRTGGARHAERLSAAVRAGQMSRADAVDAMCRHQREVESGLPGWCEATGISLREFHRIADLHRDVRYWWREDGAWVTDHVWDATPESVSAAA